MKRILLVVVILAVLGSSWFILSKNQETKEPERPEGLVTVILERGDIAATVSSTGNIEAERVRPLAFGMAGEVIEVLVAKGDRVQADQVLARLDASDLELSVRQSQASLAVSQASYDRSMIKASEADLISARAAISSAQASLVNLRTGPTSRDRELARLAIDQAKNSLWGVQGSRDAIKGQKFAADAQIDQAEAAVLNAEIAVKMAEIRYAQIDEPANASAIAAAKAQIAQAESALARLTDMPSEEDVAMAKAQVEQAKVAVEMAESRLADVILDAPSAGLLVSWDVKPGDSATPGNPVGTLLDDSLYHIMVNIDETDIGSVKVGQQVRVELDAFQNEIVTGTVAEIAPVGDSTQGIVTYDVRIDLGKTELDIRPSMTVAVDIVVEEKQGVLLVPNRAIRRDKQGKYVEILDGIVPTKTYIETGVSDSDFSEVLSGLEEGQEIVVSQARVSPFGGLGN